MGSRPSSVDLFSNFTSHPTAHPPVKWIPDRVWGGTDKTRALSSAYLQSRLTGSHLQEDILNLPHPYLKTTTVLFDTMSSFIWDLSKFLITHKQNKIWRWNLHQSNSLAKSQKALEAHGCKPWVTNLLIIPYTLGMYTNHKHYLLYSTTWMC